MTPKRVVYDPHAVERMQQRRVTRQEVRWVLAQGIREALEAREGSEQRWGRRGMVRGLEVLVVYLERADHLYIVTVQYLLSKGEVARQKRKERGTE